MLRGWTRRGRLELIGELDALTRHAEVLASQERAAGGGRSASVIAGFLDRARPVLATLKDDAAAAVTRRELATLHSLAVRQVACAEREVGLHKATPTHGGQENV